MILLYIFILIFICPIKPHTFADIHGIPSFRSSVVKDGRPILRGGGLEEDEKDLEQSEIGSSGDGKSILYDGVPEEDDDVDQTEIASTYNNDIAERNTALQKDQNLLDDISVLIEWLVDKYGYNLAVKYRRDDGLTRENLLALRARHKKRKNKKKKPKKRKGSKGRKKDKRTSDTNNYSENNNLYHASSEKNSNEHENTVNTITKNKNTKNIYPENSNSKPIFPEALSIGNINTKTENINTRTGINENNYENYEDDHSNKHDTRNKGLNVEIKPIEMDLTDIVKMIRSNMPNIVYGQQNSEPRSALADIGKNMPNVSIAFSVQI